MKIKIAEIFMSISGEAGLTIPQGQVCTIVRSQGCNRQCVYCDAEYTQNENGGTDLTINEICQRIGTKSVMITGGEPLLQPEGLRELIITLLEQEKIVQVETNGTFPIIAGLVHPNLSWVIDCKTPSSDAENYYFIEFPELLRSDCIYKFVLDLEEFEFFHMMFWQYFLQSTIPKKVIISPVNSCPKLMKELYEKCLECFSDKVMSNFIFSLQTHKLVDLR